MATAATLPSTSAFPAPIDKSYTPSISLRTLPATSSLEEVLSILDRDGGLIIEDFVTHTHVSAMKTEIDSFDTSDHINTAISILPSQTNVVPGIIGKSPTAVSIVSTDPLLLALQDKLLTDRYTVIREGVAEERQIDPLLSISVSFDIGPGAPRQRLHRDDAVHNAKHDRPFKLEEVTQFAVLVAGCDTTRENGATMFVPGSHRWGDDRQARADEVCFAGMSSLPHEID